MHDCDLEHLSCDLLAFANVEFEFPISVRYPVLPISNGEWNYFSAARPVILHSPRDRSREKAWMQHKAAPRAHYSA